MKADLFTICGSSRHHVGVQVELPDTSPYPLAIQWGARLFIQHPSLRPPLYEETVPFEAVEVFETVEGATGCSKQPRTWPVVDRPAPMKLVRS